ncbi:MAG: pyruvate kinase [Lachnospiraceae bacterium]|nr:pyruvate kinase [Lachnospiraceae bacterium]
MRKTKIVCTLGPATDREEILEKLIEMGMNVARFNFSHGTYEEQQKRMDQFRSIREKSGKPVAMLLDTKGPEIRLGSFQGGRAELESGQMFILTTEEIEGNKERAHVNYSQLPEDIQENAHILIDDGLVDMIVKEIGETEIRCQVVNDGVVSDHKGVNVPGLHLNIPYLSQKDKNDLVFGINNDIDFVAASFVRSAKDVQDLRAFLQENGGYGINIIAKIENGEGVENIDEIIEASDGILIARGDMGVELPEEEVPVVQKMIIAKSYLAGKQVITATQMLDSMIHYPRPTRAEVTDVANAVYDGTSAIMLSGETAAGKFPVEALATMIRIAIRTEEDIDYRKRFFAKEWQENPDITDAVCHATCTTAYGLNASAIVTVTKSGRSARMISRYRPACQIIGGTTSKKVWRQLALSWGVSPVLLQEKTDVFDLFSHAVQTAEKQDLLETGDLAVITSGVPIGKSGTTNMIKVERVE